MSFCMGIASVVTSYPICRFVYKQWNSLYLVAFILTGFRHQNDAGIERICRLYIRIVSVFKTAPVLPYHPLFSCRICLRSAPCETLMQMPASSQLMPDCQYRVPPDTGLLQTAPSLLNNPILRNLRRLCLPKFIMDGRPTCLDGRPSIMRMMMSTTR